MPRFLGATATLCFALLALVVLAYWPGLQGGFLFDDYPNIVSNLRVQPEALTWDAIKTAANAYQPGMYGRPIATVWFALDFLVGGKDAWVFKLSSLSVHLANALLVFALVARLLALPAVAVGEKWRLRAAFGIAALWALHPLQVSTVLYVVQRMETLATTFVLLALLAYLRGRLRQIAGRRGWPWLVLAVLMTGLGMLSKESAILAPAFALALELTVLGFGANQARVGRGLKWFYGLATLASVVVFLAYVLPRFGSDAAYAGRDYDAYERVLTQLRILPMYLQQILLPVPGRMIFYYDNYTVSTGWLSPWTTLAGGLFLLGLLAAAWRWRASAPLFALGVFWFFAAHAMTSSVFALELVFEHRNYFALLGVLLAVAEGVRRLPMRDSDGPAVKAFAVAAMVLALGVLTLIRAAIWGDPLLLATYLASKNMQSARASSDVATLYVAMSDSNKDSPFYYLGQVEFERGARLPGASPLPEQGLLLMAATTGGKVDPAWWDSLIQKLATQPIGPQQRLALNGLATQYRRGIPLDRHRLSEAYRTLLSRRDWPGYMYANYAEFLLNEIGDVDAAERMFVRAIAADPGDTRFSAQVISTLVSQGHKDMASRLLQKLNTAPGPDADLPAPEKAALPE